MYLDDQSLQFPGRNVDVYFADMERVEVLEGPQGTLFGGGAEAGAIRYITNKPKLNVTEGNAEGSYGTTAGGDPNSSVNATLNLPLIQDTLAVRAVIYDDRRGGYIDNVPSTFTRNNNDLGSFYSNILPVNGQCPNGLPNSGHCIPLGTPAGKSETLPTTTLLRYEQPAYTTFDASLGVAKDQWTATLYGTNLGNSNASVFTSSAQFIKSEVPLRPRVLGVKLAYRF